MNPLTHFEKKRILRNIFVSLSAIFALAITAHAQNPQNLYVSANRPASLGGHAILEFTPSAVLSTYASGLDNPRGLAFDSIGNLFATTVHEADNIEIGRVLKFNLLNHVSTFGSAANFTFEGLAIDIAGNVYVMADDNNSPVGAGTIFKFTPSGERIIFGSIPGQGWGLAFDRAGNLYAADGGDQIIYKFTNGTKSIFVKSIAFGPNQFPVGLAFDGLGNLFVSTEGEPGNDAVLKFNSNGMALGPFATGLTNPRGLAFDSSTGNLFVAEANATPVGDILEFPSGGGPSTVFASGFGRPEFLTFGPPR
jgi:glucose/arabinose dehydrogenase